MGHGFPGLLASHVITTTLIQYRISQGLWFTGGLYDDNLANDATLEILFQLAAPIAHSFFSIESGGDAEIQLFEDTTFSAEGAAANVQNRNRSADYTRQTTVTVGPTVTADGTAMPLQFVPGGTGGNAPGGSQTSFGEWELSPGKVYLLRGTNRSGGNKPMNLVIDFYETEEGNA